MSVIHDLLSVINTYSGVLTLLAITFGPRVLHYLVAWRSRPRSPSIPTVPLPLLGKTLLLLHTAWSLLYLLAPPYSLFASLPISASNAILRASLLRALRAPELGTLHDHLLDRLKSFDNRLAYLRYGHEPLFGCGWCLKPDDYLIYGLAGWMKGYVLEGFILGSLSFGFFGGPESGRRAEQWRSVFAWGLVLGFAGEMAVRWGWELRVVDGDCVKVKPRGDSTSLMRAAGSQHVHSAERPVPARTGRVRIPPSTIHTSGPRCARSSSLKCPVFIAPHVPRPLCHCSGSAAACDMERQRRVGGCRRGSRSRCDEGQRTGLVRDGGECIEMGQGRVARNDPCRGQRSATRYDIMHDAGPCGCLSWCTISCAI